MNKQQAPKGYNERSISLTTPRQYTVRGGWNITCECGASLGDTGYSQEEQDAMWRKRQAVAA